MPHSLKYRVATCLNDLPPTCWNIESTGNIISSFGVPVYANKTCTSWEDLTTFNISFLYEDVNSLPQIIEVTVDYLTYEENKRLATTALISPLSSQIFPRQ